MGFRTIPDMVEKKKKKKKKRVLISLQNQTLVVQPIASYITGFSCLSSLITYYKVHKVALKYINRLISNLHSS
jgi:hypothetical protein